MDSGTADVAGSHGDVAMTLAEDGEKEEEEEITPAAWHDSDDERLTISLASEQRLRKLRNTEAEDLVSGKEYIRRLRRQFERLHPTPEWAVPERSTKRRKTINGDEDDSDASSGVDDMDTSDEEAELTMQPLAKLLQNAGDLVMNEDNTKTGGKRKLRQEVIDIQRLKDVGANQPVSLGNTRVVSGYFRS